MTAAGSHIVGQLQSVHMTLSIRFVLVPRLRPLVLTTGCNLERLFALIGPNISVCRFVVLVPPRTNSTSPAQERKHTASLREVLTKQMSLIRRHCHSLI
jgi:hypothetical protein